VPNDIRSEFAVPRLNAAGFEALAEVSEIFNHAMNRLDQIFTEIQGEITAAVPGGGLPSNGANIGRERVLVVTKLQEAMSWARIAVARDPRVQAESAK
jgi:hypothetical protein